MRYAPVDGSSRLVPQELNPATATKVRTAKTALIIGCDLICFFGLTKEIISLYELLRWLA